MQIPEGYILVPVWAIKMLEYEGYQERYFYNLQDSTQLEAYYKTEEDFRKYFHTHRYKTFKSFREMTYRHLRKKSKNVKKTTTNN